MSELLVVGMSMCQLIYLTFCMEYISSHLQKSREWVESKKTALASVPYQDYVPSPRF